MSTFLTNPKQMKVTMDHTLATVLLSFHGIKPEGYIIINNKIWLIYESTQSFIQAEEIYYKVGAAHHKRQRAIFLYTSELAKQRSQERAL